MATQIENAFDNRLIFKNLQPWKYEKLHKWPFHSTYSMSHWGDRWQQKKFHCFYTEGMYIHFRYNSFCNNLMHIIGSTDLITFHCLAILLAQQAVRYVKQSKQSVLISS